MVFYLVLALATLAIAALSMAVWKRTRQVAFLIGFAFLYYWSLYGGWLVVNRSFGGNRSYRFEYLYYKLFPVYLDQDYLFSLLLYTLFIVVIQTTVLAVARPHRSAAPLTAPLYISHVALLAIVALLTAGAYALVREVVGTAIGSGASAYGAVNRGTALVPFFTVYQVFHEAAVIVVLLGLSILATGGDATHIAGRTQSAAFGYAILLPLVVGLNVVMGNRSMLAFGTVGAGLFYLANNRRPNTLVIGTGAFLAALALVMLGIVRGSAAQQELGNQDVLGKIRYTLTEAVSQDVEAFAAHASMYGALQKRVPLTYGSSFVWLATSIAPSFVRPQTVPTTYEHYAAGVGAAPDQGFTIHNATGWYLNAGVLGVITGGVVFGWIWAALYNAFRESGRARSQFGRVFTILAFWTFTAYTANLIRSGPEGYKGVLVEGLLVPAVLLFAASLMVVKRSNRLQLVPIPGASGTEYRPVSRHERLEGAVR